MIFCMVDRIMSFEVGRRIEAVKALSFSEEYLADHFPAFPVMPGVLMLETMVQSAAWLLRLSENSKGSLFLMSEARAVRYGGFVKPGDILRVKVELTAREGDSASFKGKGTVDGRNAVAGRFVLREKQLGTLNPALKQVEDKIRNFFDERSRALMECERTL